MAKVLIVDDERDALQAMEEILLLDGHKVVQAKDGKGALESVKANLPDVIVCDIEMPELKGFDVFKELKKNPATSIIPFIFLTGRNDISALVKAMELNANDFLTKPFTGEDLTAAVDNQLRKVRPGAI
jgi:DNA-binding response OmpR family regulator